MYQIVNKTQYMHYNGNNQKTIRKQQSNKQKLQQFKTHVKSEKFEKNEKKQIDRSFVYCSILLQQYLYSTIVSF